MSRECYFCKKKPVSGNKVSHSNRKSRTRWLPNLQNINILVEGKRVRKSVCTKCLKAGKAQKA